MIPIRVLLVDDSLFMRNSLKKLLSVPEIQVIDTASNGKEAVEKNLTLNPDLILLDIEMPVMNGLNALKQIMETSPVPVVMFSTLTQDGAVETIEALSLGAVDFVPKQSAYFDTSSVREDLINKIISFGSNAFLKANLISKYKKTRTGATTQAESLARSLSQTISTPPKPVAPKYQTDKKRPAPSDIKIITIGVSTGGPVALQELIPHINPNIPVPIVIIQHMPPFFTETLSKRLAQMSKIKVKESEDGELLMPGTVYIGKAGSQVIVTRRNTIVHTQEPPNELFKPSVNVLVNSVVDTYRGHSVGVIMTGMGNDGSKGLANLAAMGGYVISQDIESCVVAGMTKAVIESKIAHEIHPLKDLASVISSLFGLSAI